ncbi:helix-turn-helix domain-containing protein [Paenibacillus sp. JDR-2]|uniref:helix-turn-helix domain-containing protein n=1 Tax=Paenibacillus sp. (strain JDR-2) TaxID=324057 RepID=UPI0001AAF729|nr:helix-turn-helix domain-containing protein [Paenibacillus sp. JDR-2]ACT01909.1 transcriptional regulator, AraC family [Paenibacillus sp. JDR-2]
MRTFLKPHTKILFNNLLPFLIIMVLSSAVGYLIYQKTSSVLENETKQSNQVLLRQSMNTVDSQLRSIDGIMQKIAEEPGIQNLNRFDDPLQSKHLLKVLRAKEQLQDYWTTNDYVLDFFLFFPGNGLVLNNNFVGSMPKFQQIFSYPENKAFLNKLTESYYFRQTLPVSKVVLEGRTYTALTYLQSFGYKDYSSGTALILLREDKIQQLLRGLNIGTGWAYIADSEGRLLLSLDGEGKKNIVPLALPASDGVQKEKIDGEEVMVTYVTSSYNGWVYVAAQPKEIVLNKIVYIKEVSLTILVLFIITAALIALQFAYRSSKPVHGLMNAIAKHAPEPFRVKGHTLGAIQRAVSSLIDTHEEMEVRIRQQLPLLRASFFDRLLRGQFASEDEINALLSGLKLDWGEAGFNLAVLLALSTEFEENDHSDVSRLNERKAIIRDYLQRETHTFCYVHETDDARLALMLHFNEEDKEALAARVNELLHRVQAELKDKFGIRTLLTAGSFCRQRMDLARSFREARRAAVGGGDNGVMWYQDMSIPSHVYYYPDNVEARLFHLVKSSNEKELELLLDELERENFGSRALPEYLLQIFAMDFTGSVLKLSESAEVIGLERLSRELVHEEWNGNPKRQFLALRRLLLRSCRLTREHKQQRQQQDFEQYLRVVDEQYTDPQMSLTYLTECFNVTETYMSRRFKEYAGINFFDYLESKRIESSKHLLTEKKLTIGEIAVSVGYHSANTFGRAFKRVTGLTPNAYREQQGL